ncbi:MAG: aminomethyltransferase family protein [Clostridia bacterium]|nr:aminomethyltransferase family protein [Clostridia bacterium]
MAYNPNYHPLLTKPTEITGFWDESLSWHDGCYINTSLNSPFPACDIEGPDAEKFLEKYIVNSMENRPIGKGMHAIFCNDEGKIVADGIIVKRGEHKYRSLCIMMVPILAQMEAGNFDITITDLTGTFVLNQFCGPRSLELMEALTEEDLHDLKFMCYKETEIDGMPVDILRVGMAGTLGYEIHCKMEHAQEIYRLCMTIGEQYGIRHLGWQAYRNAHTEGGFPQASVHFWYADYMHFTDKLVGARPAPAFPAELNLAPPNADPDDLLTKLSTVLLDGSFSDAEFAAFNCTPYDVGWDKMVKFDHDFVGRSALEKIKEEHPHQVVTLEWNPEDIQTVWGSVFTDEKPFKRLDMVGDLMPYGEFEFFPQLGIMMPRRTYLEFDRVLADEKEVGISSGRMFSPHYRKMLSLCVIDKAFAEPGTEVDILWGNPGERQMKIRATVAGFPYGDIDRNEKLDVASIPRGTR